MGFLQILLLIVSLPLFGLAFTVMLIVGYQQARHKGYRTPGAALIIFAGCTVGIILTILRNPPNSTSYRFFVDFFWLPLIFASAASAVLILLLPHRTTRIFGPRQVKFPFVWVGQALLALGLVLLGISVHLWLAEATSDLFQQH